MNSFIVHVKSEDVYPDLAVDGDKRFVESNYKVERPLTIAKNEKLIESVKDQLGGK